MVKSLQDKLHELSAERRTKIVARADELIAEETYRVGDGGTLRLVAEFPDRPPVILSGFQDLDE